MTISNILGTAASIYTSNIKTTDISALTNKGEVGQTTNSKVKTYDFTNISPDQMLKTMNDLIKSGKMTVDESSSILGVMPPTALAEASGYKTTSIYQPMNFIDSLKKSIAFDEFMHNTNGVEYGQKALNALQRLQGQPYGVDVKV